jgi:hypothetical protein
VTAAGGEVERRRAISIQQVGVHTLFLHL